jgi:hypothetical protein
MVAHGIVVRAMLLQVVVIWKYYNGLEEMVVHGMKQHVKLLLAMVI